jgi:hypothetical protein
MAAATRVSRATAREGARGARALAGGTWDDARAIRALAGDERRAGGAGRGRGVVSASAASGASGASEREVREGGGERSRARSRTPMMLNTALSSLLERRDGSLGARARRNL